MSNTRATIIIPVYNQEKLIGRALDSIPQRDDIEIIVIDDGSEDNTVEAIEKRLKSNYTLIRNPENKGVAYSVNRGYDHATGDYIVLLGSDDYFYTEAFEKALEELDGTDFIFFQTTNNYGMVELNEHNKCGSFKFMRREFIKEFRNDENRLAGEDYHLWNKMLEKNPTMKELDLVVKHYNYPREGSLNWQLNEGIINLESGLKNESSNM